VPTAFTSKLILVACLAALGVLAACGGTDEADTPAGAASEREEGAFPVTLEHKFGATEIQEPPERVVTVGYTEQDIALALGVPPVGTREFLGGYDWRTRPWARDVAGARDAEVVGSEEINFERVAAARPDVLIGLNSGMTERDYEKLSQVAPTVPQSDEYIDFGVPWQEQTRVTGKALGLEDKADQLVDHVEAKFAKARKEHPEFESKTAVLAYSTPDGGFGAYATGDYRVKFFEDLGFETPAKIDEMAGESFYVDFSAERLPVIDHDVIVMYAKEEEVVEDPLFRRLDAVQEGRVIYLDLSDQLAGALGYSSPLSLPYAIDEAVPRLAAAIDGDPKTEVERAQ
jgi:iron complex transport system substrate-binding protein